MTEKDKPLFSETLSRMGRMLKGRTATEALKRDYWSVLKDMSKDDFIRVSDHILKTETWFPVPATFFAAKSVGWL